MVKQSNKLTKLVCIRNNYNITIPQIIREKIDLNIGDHIQFTWDGNGGVNIHKIIPYLVRLKNSMEGEGGNGNKHSSPSTPNNNGETNKCVEQ